MVDNILCFTSYCVYEANLMPAAAKPLWQTRTGMGPRCYLTVYTPGLTTPYTRGHLGTEFELLVLLLYNGPS